MTDRIQSAKEFLAGLVNRESTLQLMNDRVGSEMLLVIRDEAERIASIKDESNLTYDETIRSCIFIGYLLRSHMERIDLFKNISEGGY